jgi:transposase
LFHNLKDMGRKQALSPLEMAKIDILKTDGLNLKQIADSLGRSRHVIRNYLQLGKDYGIRTYKKRKGSLSDKNKRLILREAIKSSTSAAEIKNKLQLQASRRTISRVLTSSSTVEFVKMKAKPPLTENNKQTRLEWAKQRMSWTDQWNKIVFSDEKKWNLDGPDGFRNYWHDIRKEPKYFLKRQSGGGSVMTWGAFSAKDKSDLVFIENTINSKSYVSILQEHLVKRGFKMAGRNWIFQQDNASIHSSGFTKSWFEDNNINLIPWPSKSPDLNPIENLWGILARRVYVNGRQFQSREELKSVLKEEWEKISVEELKNLVESMPNRVYEVIKAQGGTTKY